LQRMPVTRSLVRLLAGVMIDRVVVTLVGLVVLGWFLVARWTPALGIGLGSFAVLLGLGAWLWRRARGSIDASEALRERAARVASLFPATLVVMGHTHLPEVVAPAADGSSTYVNLGAWAEEQPTTSASRTHLVVQYVEGRAVGSLLRWDSAEGPKRF
jgi:UDP-2,3-diacylglucosamine pyrophosphatase LpxH